MQYWSHLLHGNLGTSLNFYPASVGGLIRAALPWTVALVGVATVISFVLGTLLGVAGRLAARQLAGRAAAGHDVLPGRAVLLRGDPGRGLFADQLGWFPPNSGYDTTTLNPGLELAVRRPMCSTTRSLPAVTIVLASAPAGSSACAT